jgi:hypothetical protein
MLAMRRDSCMATRSLGSAGQHRRQLLVKQMDTREDQGVWQRQLGEDLCGLRGHFFLIAETKNPEN